jgi:hypothetical protein
LQARVRRRHLLDAVAQWRGTVQRCGALFAGMSRRLHAQVFVAASFPCFYSLFSSCARVCVLRAHTLCAKARFCPDVERTLFSRLLLVSLFHTQCCGWVGVLDASMPFTITDQWQRLPLSTEGWQVCSLSLTGVSPLNPLPPFPSLLLPRSSSLAPAPTPAPTPRPPTPAPTSAPPFVHTTSHWPSLCRTPHSLSVPGLQGGVGFVTMAAATPTDCPSREWVTALERSKRLVQPSWQALLPWETQAKSDGARYRCPPPPHLFAG